MSSSPAEQAAASADATTATAAATTPAGTSEPIAIPNPQASSSSDAVAAAAASPSSPVSTPPRKRATRCAMGGCSSPAVKSVGTCRYCSSQFCSKHRLPEAHTCPNLQSCVASARDSLAKRLISEKTVAQKVSAA
ncbi:hypothetical protein HK405_002037 [Cladochytrium tenue]|nr:hypothetical protein HK405_002037 [Cladochytrium tenue]